MKVLFVSSGNSAGGISPIVLNQGESLRSYGIDVKYYTICGKGLKGYLKSIPDLRKIWKKGSFDAVHAHYSLSAMTASLSGCHPLVVSLMGSDVMAKGLWRLIIRLFYHFFWTTCIVKSNGMKEKMGLSKVEVIPNGVDCNVHQPLDKEDCLEKLGWDKGRRHILFAADPKRYEKNFNLAKTACDLLNIPDIEMKIVTGVPNKDMPIFYNAADVVLMTSRWEGSPNVIKEAMACNAPIVSTNVGDVKWILGNTSNCFLAAPEPYDVAHKINKSLQGCTKTNGRERIFSLHLDAASVAEKITRIYRQNGV
ncbi:MAG: glycosyltransferase family 4 protein [Bacteroidetes bacterium]|nr:glycosyltransferase family 4 protein [Bacteroidota bacterium]